MTKILKRLRPLVLLTALLLLANCQEDLYENITPAGGGTSSHRMLTGPEALAQKQKLVEVLKANGGEGMVKLRSTFAWASTSRLSYEDLEPLSLMMLFLKCLTVKVKHVIPTQ